MKFTLLAFLAFIAVSKATKGYKVGKGLRRSEFEAFTGRFSKAYSCEDHTLRLKTFSETLAKIEGHNSLQNSSWRMGINHFTDMTLEERLEMVLGVQVPDHGLRNEVMTLENYMGFEGLPNTVDWRLKSVLTKVRDQGYCSAGWAFATTSQIESYAMIHDLQDYNCLCTYSVQTLISCSGNPYNCGGSSGCQGSIPQMGYLHANLEFLPLERENRYTSFEGEEPGFCYNNGSSAFAMVSGYEILPRNNMTAIMNHLAFIGPLTVAVDATWWFDYQDGVFDGCGYDMSLTLNHWVQLVGYGTTPDGEDYWMIRNSWGTEWGINGYMMLKREKDEVKCTTNYMPQLAAGCQNDGQEIQMVCGMCGVLFEASYPTGVNVLDQSLFA